MRLEEHVVELLDDVRGEPVFGLDPAEQVVGGLRKPALLSDNSSLARQPISVIDTLSHHVLHNIVLFRPLILLFHTVLIELLQCLLVLLIRVQLMLLIRLLCILDPIIVLVFQPLWWLLLLLLRDLLVFFVVILEKHALFLGLEPFILVLEGEVIDYLRYFRFANLFEMLLNKQILKIRDSSLLFFVIMLY